MKFQQFDFEITVDPKGTPSGSTFKFLRANILMADMAAAPIFPPKVAQKTKN